jgi:hypothetical protein
MMDFRVRALRVKADLFQFRGRQRPNKALEPTAVGVAYFFAWIIIFLESLAPSAQLERSAK